MPKTKKEELFFTLMMCTAMLAMMISYNQVMAAGSMKALTFGSWLHEAVIMGPVIVALEFSIIAPLAHKIAFWIIRNYTHDRIPIPIVISVCTVCCVCPTASAAAVLLVRHITENFGAAWLAALSMNFPIDKITFIFFFNIIPNIFSLSIKIIIQKISLIYIIII